MIVHTETFKSGQDVEDQRWVGTLDLNVASLLSSLRKAAFRGSSIKPAPTVSASQLTHTLEEEATLYVTCRDIHTHYL